MRRTPMIPVALAAISLVATAFAPAATAAEPDVVADGLISPLSLAVGADGTAFVAQNFAGILTKAAPGADAAPLYTDGAGREVGGVSVLGGSVTFTTTAQGGKPGARLWTVDAASGDRTHLANILLYERRNNPDGHRKYGVIGLSESCKRQIPKDAREGVVAYNGIKESHPYSTFTTADAVYVGDAAANAIFKVTDEGVSTVAVLPPVKVKVTKKLRKGFGLPRCAQGHTFKGEPVPTDIELGPDGNLYVTTLGGGIGEQLPVGAVYQVNPTSGKVTLQAGGLPGPVGLAISPTGTAYISLLFAGQVMQKPLGGEVSLFAEVPFPGDVEVSGTDVYVTATDLMNDGSTPPAGQVLKF